VRTAVCALNSGDHIRLRLQEERDDRRPRDADQHATLVVDAGVVREQAGHRLRSVGVLRQRQEEHHQVALTPAACLAPTTCGRSRGPADQGASKGRQSPPKISFVYLFQCAVLNIKPPNNHYHLGM